MWKVDCFWLNEAGEEVWLRLHEFPLKRDAEKFAGKWQVANPGKYTRVNKL